MRCSHKTILAGLILTLTTSWTNVTQAHAQAVTPDIFTVDAFPSASQGARGNQRQDDTYMQTSQNSGQEIGATLQNENSRAIEPQQLDSIYVTGANSEGIATSTTASLDGWIKIILNGAEIFGLIFGGPALIFRFLTRANRDEARVYGLRWGHPLEDDARLDRLTHGVLDRC